MANHTERRDQKLGTQIETVVNSSDTLAVDVVHPLREKALVRKLDYHLMPGIALLYLMCFLDRSNCMARYISHKHGCWRARPF